MSVDLTTNSFRGKSGHYYPEIHFAAGRNSLIFARDGDGQEVVIKASNGSSSCLDWEIQVLKRIAGRKLSVVKLLDEGIDNNLRFAVLEYVKDKLLSERLSEGLLSVPSTLLVLEQYLVIAKALQALGIFHRDLKPGNTFIDENDKLRLFDFDIAMMDLQVPLGCGLFAGSPLYIDPDSFVHNSFLGARSEIYSIGLIGVEILIGLGELPTLTDQEILLRKFRFKPSFPEDTPRSLAAILSKASDPESKNRYVSFDEFHDDLRRVRSELSL